MSWGRRGYRARVVVVVVVEIGRLGENEESKL